SPLALSWSSSGATTTGGPKGSPGDWRSVHRAYSGRSDERWRKPLKVCPNRPIVLASCGLAREGGSSCVAPPSSSASSQRPPVLLLHPLALGGRHALAGHLASRGQRDAAPVQELHELQQEVPPWRRAAGARDKVKPGNEPVTNFRRSNAIFRRAMSWHTGLDADKDRIAFEKH